MPGRAQSDPAAEAKQLFEKERWPELTQLLEKAPRDSADLDYYYGIALAHLERLADSPALVAEMGRSGRERAQQLFSSEIFAAGLNAIYQRIMEICKTRRGDQPGSGPRRFECLAAAHHVEDAQAVISVSGHRDKPAVGADGHAVREG